MAETDISICARALVLLGAEPISAFTDQTDAAKICANTYAGIKRHAMGSYDWRFLMSKKSLTRDSVSPVGEWKYSYILPGEALSLTHAVFSSATGTIASNEFEIFGRRIFTDHETVIADFVVDKAESTWPVYFVEFVVAAVCANIAFAITDQNNVAQMWNEKAFGSPSDGGMGGLMGQAMSIDSQSDGNVGLVNDEFVNARFGGW